MKNDYSQLVHLVFQLVNAQQGRKVDGNLRLLDVHALVIKLLQHLVSMLQLCELTNVDHEGRRLFTFVDHSSVKVLGRAALESYLVVYYLAGDGDDALLDFRYRAWKLAGLVDRQKIELQAQDHRDLLQKERQIIDALKEEIKASPFREIYTPKQFPRVLAGEWRIGKSWLDLAKEAGLHEKWITDIYGYLCGYSHSSYLSALQVRNAISSIDDQQKLARAILYIGLVTMAHLASLCGRLFAAEAIIKADPNATALIEKWCLKSQDMEPMYP